MDGIGVVGLAVGLVIALSSEALRDATMRRLGWLLAAASFLLLLTGTLAPPSSSGNHHVPTAPAPTTPSPLHPGSPARPYPMAPPVLPGN